MKPTKSLVLEPIDRYVFRKHVLISYFFQFLSILSTFKIIQYFELQASEMNNMFNIGVVLGINYLILFFIFDFKKFQARFKDIYPESDLGIAHYIIIGLFPVLFVGLVIFLSIKKNKSHVQKPPSFRYVYLSFLPVVCFQLMSPSMAYLTASPSSYYIIDLLHSTSSIIKLKDAAKDPEFIFDQYIKESDGSLSSSEVVLVTAVGATLIVKEKERTIASEKNEVEMQFKYGIKFLRTIKSGQQILSKQKASFFDYSLLQWLHPTGTIEIFLLSSVETELKNKFHEQIHERYSKFMDAFKKKIDRLPASRREYYSNELKKLEL